MSIVAQDMKSLHIINRCSKILAKASCLFTSTCSVVHLQQREYISCWENDWTEQINCVGRQVMLEAVGVLCLALKYLKETGSPEVYRTVGRVLLSTADHAVHAITRGWPSLVDELAGHLTPLRFEVQPKPNPRFSGFEFLLDECLQWQPKGKIVIGYEDQLTSVLNIFLVIFNIL